MSGGGTGAGAKSGGEGRDTDPIAVLAQLGSGENPYTVVHQHGGRTRLRSLTQAKGKQRYRLAGGEVVARPTARFTIAGDRDGAALISCFGGRVEVRAKHQQLTLEPHQAAILAANGDLQQFASLVADRLGADSSMDVHELVEAATRALVEAPSATAPADAEREERQEKTAALVGAAAASAPEIVLPDASLTATGDLDDEGADEAEAEAFPEERKGSARWILAALGVAAVIALVLLAVLPGGDADDDDDAVAGPATTLERTTTTDDPAAATTVPETTATTAAAETTTTEAPTTTTIAPPTASLQPKSCVQQGTTITYSAGLTNTSKVRASYDIRVAFIDQTGSEVGSATATVEDVAPGSSKDWSATGSVPSDLRDTGASCAVTSITGRPA